MREDSVDVMMEAEAASETQQHTREKPDGMVDPAGEAGWYLQRERENRGERSAGALLVASHGVWSGGKH